MAAQNWDNCIELSRGNEGGFQCLRTDAGNWTGGKVGLGKLVGTNFGIAAASHPNVDIRALTWPQAKAIYRADYWGPIHGDTLPVGVDACVLDDCINAGPGSAIKRLQAAVGATPDGAFGPKTAAAVAACDPVATIGKLCDLRLADYRTYRQWGGQVEEGKSTTYGDVWTARIAHVRSEALKMVAAPAPTPVASVPKPPMPMPAARPEPAPPVPQRSPSISEALATLFQAGLALFAKGASHA